ncbi:uncharacterized protein LOC129179570 [Dunckerocampus dactyliophorus]|uniref:uncharacterized protein LOC129179570 n=1 Tax=Dunckerocampus dactyliophorus TaxID=161453 RepID=UPI00240645F8|nr:uncharacterized protein LOC129179570 [Dunckerocampus dactyliophorus]
MMDNLTANKRHPETSSQAWPGQTSWSGASTLNSMSSCQSPGRGSAPSAQRPHCNQQQTPDDSFLCTLASVTHGHSSVSPASLFANAASHAFTFDHGHSPPVQQVDTRGGHGPLQTHLSSHTPSFQSPLSNRRLHGGPSPISFQSTLEESAPLVTPQWMSSSHCSADSSAAQPDKDGSIPTPDNSVTKRSEVLRQRSLLLKQLSELDKLLESLPPDDDDDNDDDDRSPHSDAREKHSTELSDAGHHGFFPSDDGDISDTLCDPGDDGGDISDALCDPGGDISDAMCDSGDDDGNISDTLCDPGDDDISDALCDPGDDDSIGSVSSSDKFCRSTDPLGPPDEEKPHREVAKPEWNLLKNVKVCAMKERPAASKKSCKRVYRRNYCLFCGKHVTKMSRHLERFHSHKAEVAAALRFPKGSRERQKVWNRLINEGNFAHNKQVLKTGEGQLAARKRPHKTGQAQDFLHCLHCRGLFMKKSLTGHMKRCPEREKDSEPRIRQERVETRCALEAIGDLGVSQGFRAVLSQMIYDDVTRLILTEPILLQYGEDMFKIYGADTKRQEYMRQNLRQMARLVLEAWKRTPLKKMEEFFLPDSFQHVVSAVNVLAGHNAARRTYSKPSLAIKLGYSLQKVCHIVQERALQSGDTSLAESAKDFLVVYRKEWNRMISSGALSALRKTKKISKERVPDVQVVKRLNFHVEKVHLLAEEKLRADPTAETYGALARVILARIVLFNRRQSTEVSTMLLTALKSCKKPNPQNLENLAISVCELEESMCRVFTRIEIRATCGRMVPVLLKPSFLSTLELLADVREACGVPAKNPFLFGRPHTLSAYRGSKCIQKFAKDSGAKDPDALTAAKIRKHHAAMLQLINLDELEAEQILGPGNQVKSLRRNISLELKDVGMDCEGLNAARLQCGGPRPVASWDHSESFRGVFGTSMINSTPSRQPALKGSQVPGKHKWSEAEVHAVERHMMAFIRGHKVPQKHDCIRCLNAEPRALGTRSWKGVKDYVRNRITALKRQSARS